MGVRGRNIVDRMIRGAISGECFVDSNCHFIFKLLVVGNIVNEEE